MNNDEIKETLQVAERLINKMDVEHAKELLKALVDAHEDKDSDVLSAVFLLQIDIKKIVENLISDIVKGEHLDTQISRKQMKQIYIIMGDYGVYPTCPLCGKQIKINSKISYVCEQSQKMMFSWDHIKPKCKGGSDGLTNMQPTHKICNNKKADKILTENSSNFETHCEIENEQKYRPMHFVYEYSSWHKDQKRQCRR